MDQASLSPLPSSSTTSLLSLPNELLQYIFDSWDQSYILPPINRFLLPHHRLQRFRSVTLTPRNYHALEAAAHSNGALKGLIQFFYLEVASWTYHQSFHRLPLPRELSSFLASLSNLKQISLRLAPGSGEPLLSPSNHFLLNPGLEYLVAKPFVRNQDLDGENWRYSTTSKLAISATNGISVDFSTTCASISILSTLANPSSLTHLNVTLVAHTAGVPLLGIDALQTFANLTHLALSGALFPPSTEFYKTLRQFPLQSLQFGPNSYVDIRALIQLLTDRSDLNRINLNQLVLDNIDAKVPAEEEEADLEDWVVPDWTETCTKEGVEKLRIVANALGIEIAGSTFLGVDIEDSEAYQEALERAQDADQSGSEDEDEAEDGDEAEDESEGEDSDEDESEMEEREQEADMESDHHESEYEAECGYDRSWGSCWKYADLRGFRRRRY